MVQLHELIDIFCIGEHDTQIRCLKLVKKVKITRNNEHKSKTIQQLCSKFVL